MPSRSEEKTKDGNHLHVHESVVSVKEVLKRSRELGVSMTVFLTAVFLKAIHEEMSKMQEKKPDSFDGAGKSAKVFSVHIHVEFLQLDRTGI